MVYIVMRDKGLRSDGYYYESDKSIIGVKDTEIKAKQLLNKAIEKYHPNEQPIESTFDEGVSFILSAELYDLFWIETFGDNEERLTDDNDEGV